MQEISCRLHVFVGITGITVFVARGLEAANPLMLRSECGSHGSRSLVCPWCTPTSGWLPGTRGCHGMVGGPPTTYTAAGGWNRSYFPRYLGMLGWPFFFSPRRGSNHQAVTHLVWGTLLPLGMQKGLQIIRRQPMHPAQAHDFEVLCSQMFFKTMFFFLGGGVMYQGPRGTQNNFQHIHLYDSKWFHYSEGVRLTVLLRRLRIKI